MSKIISILAPYPIFFSARVAYLVPADTISRNHSQTQIVFDGKILFSIKWLVNAALSHRADYLQ